MTPHPPSSARNAGIARAARGLALLVALMLGLGQGAAQQRLPLTPEQIEQLRREFQQGPQAVGERGQVETNPGALATDAAPINAPAIETFEPVVVEQRQRDAQDRTTVDPTRETVRAAPPGEFELYVARVVGRPLRRFGADLLTPSARDFQTPATATVPADYVLNPGDSISIDLTGSLEASIRTTIDTNGRVFIPRVGSVRVAGVRYGDLNNVLQSAVGRLFRQFEVNATVQVLRGIQVYVVGFANRPGAYTLNSLSTLLNATLAAGGPSAGGSFRSIQVYRNGALVSDFDLYALLRGGDRSRDIILQNEDVLYIPPVGQQVAIAGSVNSEAIYEAAPEETIAQVLAYAGGINPLADTSRILLYRVRDLETTGSQELQAASVASTAVENGDIVRVLSVGDIARPLQRQWALVRLEGEVSEPGNYYLAPGSTVADVLERAGGLTGSSFVFGTRIERTSVRDQQRIGFAEAISQLEVALAGAPLNSDGVQNSAERAAQLAAARAVLDRLRQQEPDGRIVLDLPPAATTLPLDMVLENGDRIYVPPRPTTVGVFGAVYRAGSFQINEPRRVREYIELAGGTTRLADRRDIFVVRANGGVISRRGDAWDAVVVPGDVIFVPTRTRSYSLLAAIRDIAGIIFQFGLGAAAFAAVAN